jgi:hypothetical protein
MVDKLDLYLATDIDRFETWLNKRFDPALFDLGDRRSLSVSKGPTPRGMSATRMTYDIKAHFLEPNPEKPDVPIVNPEFSIIEFEVFDLAENRTLVRIIPKDIIYPEHPELMVYFLKKLSIFGKYWPESREAIIKWLKNYYKELDLQWPESSSEVAGGEGNIAEILTEKRGRTTQPGYDASFIIYETGNYTKKAEGDAYQYWKSNFPLEYFIAIDREKYSGVEHKDNFHKAMQRRRKKDK